MQNRYLPFLQPQPPLNERVDLGIDKRRTNKNLVSRNSRHDIKFIVVHPRHRAMKHGSRLNLIATGHKRNS